MNNSNEVVEKIVEVFDSYDFYEGNFVVSNIVTDIVSVYGEGSGNSVVEGTLLELDYINDLINEENFIQIGNRLNCLRDNIVNGDILQVSTDKNLIVKKAFDILKDSTKRGELDRIIYEALERP